MFEISGEKLFSQWDCLPPGEHRIEVAIYSKNAAKVKRDFSISWSGKWADKDAAMFKQLIIK